MNRIVIAIAIASFAAVSCSKKLNISDMVVSNKYEVNAFDFDRLDSRARIKYDDGNKRVALNANIRIKKDSVIWISLSPMLGIEVARGLITKDSLVLLDRINQEYKIYDYVSLSREFNFSVNYDLIQAFLLGNMPWEANLEDKLRKNKDQFLVKQEVGPIYVENYINPETMKIQRVHMQEGPASRQLTFSYDDFQVLEKQNIFPFSSDILLTYTRYNKNFNTSINIDHSRVSVDNDGEMSFPFNIPDKYARKW